MLLAQGPGFSNPLTAGAGGSTTWLDDYLEYTFGAAGTYYLEVDELAVLERPADRRRLRAAGVASRTTPTAGFLFAPSPVLENENGNNTTPQAIDASDDFFKFFDPNVGDTLGAAHGRDDRLA